MKEVKCPSCNKKLGEIDEEQCSITFEKGVEAKEPYASMGMVVVPYTCPDCKTTHMETIIL